MSGALVDARDYRSYYPVSHQPGSHMVNMRRQQNTCDKYLHSVRLPSPLALM